jgi:hypothetical protein
MTAGKVMDVGNVLAISTGLLSVMFSSAEVTIMIS